MSDESVEHPDNDTPDASDDDVKRMDADTPGKPDVDARPGESVDEGAGASPVESTPETTDDPKGSGRPV